MVAGDDPWARIRLITPGGFGIRVQQFIDLEVIFIIVVQTPKNEKEKSWMNRWAANFTWTITTYVWVSKACHLLVEQPSRVSHVPLVCSRSDQTQGAKVRVCVRVS
jgi:hypothetical protein